MYNDTVLDHFTNPRNVGSITNADGIGQTGNPADGDKVTIYIKVRHNTLVDVRFKTFGCGAAIAASSMLTVLSMGKSIEDAMKITNDDVAEALGGLPPQKIDCSNIAADALHTAINDYLMRVKLHPSQFENFLENTTENFSNQKKATNRVMDKNQIQRYLRHIIMPKISGVGQQKLLDTRVFVYSQSVNACDVLLNYMAASGIGKIYCLLENKTGWNALLAHVHDLNPDITIELVEEMTVMVNFNIIIGNFDFAGRMIDMIESDSLDFSPTFIAVTYAWQGYVTCCHHGKSMKAFLAEVSKNHVFVDGIPNQKSFQELGLSMSTAFFGPFLVIELIKMQLKIGNILDAPFYFNLLDMSFINDLSECERHLKNSQSSFDHLNESLAQAKVLIVGTGGLGCPNALSLARAGVETIGLIDYDVVELSNLNRQILHTTSKIGLPKVESAKQALKRINPNLNIELHQVAFSRQNALDIIKNYDIVIDGLDNLPTRYLLNDACFFGKKPLVDAGVLAFYGQLTTISPGDDPCYRCIFPETATSDSGLSCSEVGVLGPVPGLMGVLQSVETLKIIMGVSSSLKGGLLLYDALETEFEVVKFQRNNDCKLCGKKPTILELGEATFVCTDKMDES